MVFKSNHQKWQEYLEYVQSIKGKKEQVFIIFPRTLQDGRTAWMQKVWRTPHIVKSYSQLAYMADEVQMGWVYFL